jgi:hypothetical protein
MKFSFPVFAVYFPLHYIHWQHFKMSYNKHFIIPHHHQTVFSLTSGINDNFPPFPFMSNHWSVTSPVCKAKIPLPAQHIIFVLQMAVGNSHWNSNPSGAILRKEMHSEEGRCIGNDITLYVQQTKLSLWTPWRHAGVKVSAAQHTHSSCSV